MGVNFIQIGIIYTTNQNTFKQFSPLQLNSYLLYFVFLMKYQQYKIPINSQHSTIIDNNFIFPSLSNEFQTHSNQFQFLVLSHQILSLNNNKNLEFKMNDTQQKIDKKFLFKQNKKLRLELKETKQLVKAHKDAINRLTSSTSSQHQIISALVTIVMKQNPHAQEIAQISQELSEMTHKKNLLEKMIAQTEDQQQENYHLLVEDLQKLRKTNSEMESQLHKFYEKIGEVDYLSGLVVKYKELTTPKEQSIAFKKQQDQLLEFISLQRQTINRLTEEKNKLLKINVHMKDEVQKKKDDIRNMTVLLTNPDALSILNTSTNQNNLLDFDPSQNILDELQQQENHQSVNLKQPTQSSQLQKNETQNKLEGNSNNSMMNFSNLNNSLLNTSAARNLNTTLNFIKLQRQIIKEKEDDGLNSSMDMDSEDFDCPEFNILFPDKVQQIRKDRETAKVPYLNMMKIREMMAKRESKIRRDVQADSKHINPTEKIIKLETELEITRKQLTNLTLKFRLIDEKIKKMQKYQEEMENRNNILIRANQKYMHGYRNIYRECMWGRKVWSIVGRRLKLGETKQFGEYCCEENGKVGVLQGEHNEEERNQLLQQLEQKILQLEPAAYILQLQKDRQEHDQGKLKELNNYLNKIFHKNQQYRESGSHQQGHRRSLSQGK